MGIPKRLVGPLQLAASDATLYTAPSYIPNTLVTVIRRIHLYNADTVVRNVTLAIGDSATASKRILDAWPMPAASMLDLYGPFTLAQAETFEGFASAATIVTIVVDGVEAESGS